MKQIGDYRIIEINQKYLDFYKIPKEELINRAVKELFPDTVDNNSLT